VGEADRELDPAKRHQLIDQIYARVQGALPALPLYSLSNLLFQPLMWRTDVIAGPIGGWIRSPYGPLWNMDFWYRAPG
jgi:ABC-type transport system substrate-binding protein